jgi:16S rRNA (uracil1498-N3)-methyltransferase
MNIFIASVNNKTATLTPKESWHCAKVLRYKTGDTIDLIDGVGAFYKATLQTVHEKQCVAEIIQGPTYQKKRNYYLHLAIAPTKQIDRIEWMIEKAVEIGIDEISFIKCKNSERVNIKTERIQKIVESAVKQSKQAFIPKINELIDFKNILQNAATIKLIAHCEEENKMSLKDIELKSNSICVLVGPEGDFTHEEISQAKQNDFKPITLGENRLRTETAGLYVVQAFSILTL